MKLLIDENLSPTLVKRLADLFPDSKHVRDVGLEAADDSRVWEYATATGAVVLTKDVDLYERALLAGHPPKVIRVCLGNCSTDQIESLIRWRVDEITLFIADGEAACLELR